MVCSDVEIGKRIAKLRKKCQMTQNELAESVGLSRPILAKIETGSQPLKPDQLYSICKVLGVTADFLLSGVATENVTISDDLGLSQSAIEALKMLKNSSYGKDILYGVNMLLEKVEGHELLESLYYYFTIDFDSAYYDVSVSRFVDGKIQQTEFNVPHAIEELHFKNDSGDAIEIEVSMLRFALLEGIKNEMNIIRKQVRDRGEK